MTAPPKPPAHIEVYVEVFGVDGAITFLTTFGGAELYVPQTPSHRSELVRIMGIDGARALAREAHRVPRSIPTGRPWIARVLRSKGLPVAQIARKLHSTEGTVRRWLRSGDQSRGQDDRQLPLF